MVTKDKAINRGKKLVFCVKLQKQDPSIIYYSTITYMRHTAAYKNNNNNSFVFSSIECHTEQLKAISHLFCFA